MRIGIDLGGTKIEGIALDATGREVDRRRRPTPAGDYPGILATIAAIVAEIEAAVGAKAPAVGVGIPGVISPATGLIKNANSTWLIGRPLDKDLEAALGRPVRLENDANCLVVSEAADGAAAGARVVFAAILGTGVGGGIAIDGRPLAGANAIGGEWGHNPLPWPHDDERPGPACYCGRDGCIETFLSGPGMTLDFRVATGRTLGTVDIVAAADAGDAEAEACLARYENRLARSLATIVNVLDPDVIVLGGGMSNIERLYRNVPCLWGEWIFSDHVDTPLRRNRHGDSSGVRGAAWLWPDPGPDAANYP